MRKRQPKINREGSHQFAIFDILTITLTYHDCVVEPSLHPRFSRVSHPLLLWTLSASPRTEADILCESVQHYHRNFVGPFCCFLDVVEGYKLSWRGQQRATNLLRIPGEHCIIYCWRFWVKDQLDFEEPFL